ncbi:hypothetical protein Ae201684P_005734 [Aphanomyces euteiches]|uniref:RanBP2-type domain-containing protein n=1 Tax=Aphanomyces euteiches TaxID=100861 RepID=A0A6G0X0F3_9STRA|nr:hypothetical protein Ae201684_009610 [Aphanomyces euteiches]KAH9086038.1 hypothetical protein Ae201684P_005734 [Aphanomyces euteiches]KAH9157855.1 hypothetical protein AeRB84_000327 [Aphanomyces euteiches]
MCGRACCILAPQEICEAAKTSEKDFLQQEKYTPHYNVSPGMYTPIQYRDRSTKRMIVRPMKWGLIPSYIKPEEKVNHFMRFNARSETMSETPAYRQLVDQKRCVVLLNGFYEWHKLGKTDKQPYFIYVASDSVMRMAGLYDVWQDPSGEKIFTYSIITTESPTKMSWLHNRMPMMLKEDEVETWLQDGTLSSTMSLVHPYAHDDIAFHAVTKQLGQLTFESSSCITKVDISVIGKITSFYKQETEPIEPKKEAPSPSPPQIKTSSTPEKAINNEVVKQESTKEASSIWACPACTFENAASDGACAMCGTESLSERTGWTCHACTFVNPSMTSSICSMCHAFRKRHQASPSTTPSKKPKSNATIKSYFK